MTEKTIKRTEQVNQTMAMLTEALTKLMVKKPLDQITIAELTEEAGLARRTFYRHVKTIDDLLTIKVEQIITKLYQEVEWHSQTFEDVLNKVYPALLKDKTFLLALAKNNREYLLQKVILDEREQSIIQLPKEPVYDLTAYFGAGGISSVIIYWIHQGFRQSPEEVAKANRQLIQHIKRITQ